MSDKFLDATGKLIETIPTLYEDALQPAVQEGGKLLAKLPKAINAAFVGVDCWYEKRMYRLEETKKILAKKLENVEPEKIVPPEPYIAIPAIEAISYSMDSEELKELFANLLANAMNKDVKSKVLPAFVEFIKQLSPLDARNLNYINRFQTLPIVNIRAQESKEKTNGVNLFDNFFLNDDASIDAEDNSISVTNLSRLGLIEIVYGRRLTHDVFYDRYYKSEIFLSTQAEYNSPNVIAQFNYITLQKGMLSITPLGKAFAKICCPPPEPLFVI